ncbi:peptidase associated/transthyretin-like domain-containing protein [Ekhidna sp.]
MEKQSIVILFMLSIILLGNTSFKPVQTSKTKLYVTVIDGSGNQIEDAAITIYTSEDDYKNNANKLIEGKTDKKGKFQFKGLGIRSYFLDVRKNAMNNDGEDVQTGLLSEGKINRVIVVIK